MDWRRWGPVLVWAACIFMFSSSAFGGEHTSAFLMPLLEHYFPGVPHEHLLRVHAGVRKLAHFTEYAILSVLLLRALRDDERPFATAQALAILAAALYACTDELHQAFVPNRTAAVGDVMIDALGASCAQAVMRAWVWLSGRIPFGA